ncbi:MAG: hypothetical protein H6709_13180 [Kofleriaceae bacterium]|nr:hypothetical protein [Kofleriaceae bacterium]
MIWLALMPAAVAAVTPAPGATDPACAARTAATLDPDTGTSVTVGARCGEVVIATDGSDRAFSWGSARYRGELPADYQLTLWWQRLSADSHRTLELFVPGGAILVRDGAYAFYENDARFVAEGWQPRAGLDTRAPHCLRVVQHGVVLQAWLDDDPLGTYTFTARPATGHLRIGLKGERGYRGRMRYRELVVEPLAAQ